MKLLAVTITFHPDINLLANNISRYLGCVEHLIIWDNGGDYDQLAQMKLGDKTEIMGVGKNVGIAYAANRAVEWGIKHGYSHILTMDQDSTWDNFESYRDHIINSSQEGVAMYSPTIRIGSVTVDFKGISCFTSGAVMPLDIFKELGLYREDYEIDNVDTEFCYRCRAAGYKIEFLPDILFHELGHPKIIWGNRVAFNYSPYRLYHITRNELKIWKDYRNVPIAKVLPKFYKVNYRILLLANNIILGESNKIQKLKAIAKGYWEGIIYNPKKKVIERIK